MNLWNLALTAWAYSALVMLALLIFDWRRKNSGTVDVVWTFGVGITAVVFCVLSEGDFTRRAIVGALVGIWSARLTGYLALRVARMPEDGRYTYFRRQFGKNAFWVFLAFYQLQASWVVLFALPSGFASQNPQSVGVWDLAGILFFLTSIVGTAVSDRQLHSFRSDPKNRGQVCQVGLWRYSRHPNYFFEWLQWWSYPLFCVGSSWFWFAAASPVVMLIFLLKFTGIPHTERQALASRGEAYARYQASTNAFFPARPKGRRPES